MGILTEMVRDNFRVTKMKVILLPALGELLYLIASQEDSRCRVPGGSPEVVPTWSVSPNTYTLLRKCLRGEGEEAIVNHIAAKIMENVACTRGTHAQVGGLFSIFVRLVMRKCCGRSGSTVVSVSTTNLNILVGLC